MLYSKKRSLKTILAFSAIYFIWGSTYLAIRFAIETVPPFFMMGCRLLLAGGVLFSWALLRGKERPRPAHWATSAILAVLLFVGGQGIIAWSEQTVPSGVAAVIVSTVPIWITVLQAIKDRDHSLSGRVILGLALGFIGMVFLTKPVELIGGKPVDPIGVVALLFAAVSWSVGSVYSKNAKLPGNPILAAGMNLICGGGALLLVSVLGRETVVLTHVSLRSFVSMIYLVAFGSVIAFTAYLWLMRSVHPARVATYAYVNPVVAVFVGWVAGGESLNPGIVFSAALMAVGVAVIITRGSASRLSPNKTQHGAKIFRVFGLNFKKINKELTF